jgi:spore photoproduct lyase
MAEIMSAYQPDVILVQEDAARDGLAREILARLPGVATRSVGSADEILPRILRQKDPISAGKRILILSRHPGGFMNSCPGDGAEMCCNYQVANHGWNCPMDCTYCVLQAVAENPALRVFTNWEDMKREVTERLAARPDRTFRVGTGDMSDSLALDHITHYSRRLVPFFATLTNGLLEMKTKSGQVCNLEGLEHGGRTIVSWSMNSRRVIRSEERGTASFEERLAAAVRCQEWGYRVGFHFDPLISYEGWEEEYREVVRELFRNLNPSAVAWVSLGGLRFTQRLKDIMRRRFPHSKIPYGEFVPGNHGKQRYFRPIREEMYRKMKGWIDRAAPGVFTYLCMENREAWHRCIAGGPSDAAALSEELDRIGLTGNPPSPPAREPQNSTE